MRAAPEVPCAMGRRVRARAYRAAEAIRHSLRNGFTAYNALSPVSRSSLATVAPGKLVSPELDASIGRQDHTTSRQGHFSRCFRIVSAAGPGWALDQVGAQAKLAET